MLVVAIRVYQHEVDGTGTGSAFFAADWRFMHVVPFCWQSIKATESKLAMMEANEEQLKQRQERLVAEKEEEDRLIQTMLNKFKVWYQYHAEHEA